MQYFLNKIHDAKLFITRDEKFEATYVIYRYQHVNVCENLTFWSDAGNCLSTENISTINKLLIIILLNLSRVKHSLCLAYLKWYDDPIRSSQLRRKLRGKVLLFTHFLQKKLHCPPSLLSKSSLIALKEFQTMDFVMFSKVLCILSMRIVISSSLSESLQHELVYHERMDSINDSSVIEAWKHFSRRVNDLILNKVSSIESYYKKLKISKLNLSSECDKSIQFLFDGAKQGKGWALKSKLQYCL